MTTKMTIRLPAAYDPQASLPVRLAIVHMRTMKPQLTMQERYWIMQWLLGIDRRKTSAETILERTKHPMVKLVCSQAMLIGADQMLSLGLSEEIIDRYKEVIDRHLEIERLIQERLLSAIADRAADMVNLFRMNMLDSVEDPSDPHAFATLDVDGLHINVPLRPLTDLVFAASTEDDAAMSA